MSKSLQTKPQFQLLLTEPQVRAIGHVTAQWAFLESEINREISWLLTRSEHKHKKINFQSRFAKRTNRWLELAKRSYKKHPKLIKAVQQIMGRAIAIKPERDQLAHGTLSGDGTFFKSREGKLVDISDFTGRPERIEDLACRISDINAALFYHQTSLQRHFRSSP